MTRWTDLTAPSTPGTYYYGACVEAVSDESDTTNNCSPAVTVTVGAAPAPDLVVDTPTVSESAPAAGARFTLSATVRNQGNGSSAFTTLRYYQSTDSTINADDTEVGTDSVSSLDASESGDEWISLTAPSTPGVYFYGACVDSVPDETDTTNNCSVAVTVTVGAAPAPDLVVDPPTVDTSAPTAGASFTLSATVRNQGNGRSDSTTLRYYQSTDSTITSADTQVGTDSVFRLNASSSGDESASLTAPSNPGTYYYGACVDSVSDETETINNCSSAVAVTVGAAPAPDLVVDTPTVDTRAPTAGASFTLSATVRNQGNGRSYSTTLRYYQSTDSTITTGDTEVGTDSVSGLSASRSGDESISLSAPSDPGTYYLGACVDAVPGETDTTNNCSAGVQVTVGAAPAPDLVVDTPTVSESAPAAGARITLSATVRNQGNGRSDSTTLRYYESTDPTITTGDTEIDTDSVFRLDAAESGDESISLDAPSTPGTYYYGACVDALSDESDTTNNCSPAVTVTVGAAPAPDLVVDAPTVSESAPAAGASFRLSATVRNQGNDSAGITTLHYYRSTDSAITAADMQVGTDDLVFHLAASETSDKWTDLTAPSTPGTYYYGACVEAVSDESDTTNNCSPAVTVTVGAAPAPDLVVDTPTVSESAPAAGARFTLSATVRNQGNGSSAFTTQRYYQSTDSTITAGDTEVGTDSVSRLDASESGDESVSVTAPSTSGTYYYGACVEAVSDESDTTNNCSPAVTVTVGAAPAPDLVVDTPTVSDNAPTAGARFTLSATVRNQGSGPADSTTLRYYQSTDSTITTSDTEVGTDSVSRLDASESGDESVSVTAPSTPGTYYYGACVDAVSDEPDVTNNCSPVVTVTVGAAPAPDVVLSAPRVSDSTPTANASFILSITAENQGSASSQPTTLRFYRSTDSTISSSDSALGTYSVPLLGPGGGSISNATLSAPPTPGTYYYGACVDAVSDESDTTNNCSPAVTVTVGAAPAPDLVVDVPTVDASAPAAGARITLNATVRNQGAARSGSTTLRYYQSTDATITADDTEVGTDSVFGLAASASGDESISLTAPSTPGTYYYGACVDEVAGELDTTNNCSAVVQVAVSTTTGGNRYNVGDALPGVPTSGTFIPAVSSGVSLQSSVGNTTITFGNGGYIELQDGTRYTCESLDGCEVVNGEVTRGTIVGQATASSSSPDLVVDTPMVSESSPTAGASFTLSATVRNQGAARSDSTTLRYYQSTDSTITTSDTEVGTDSVFGLAASASGDESVSLTAPSSAGTYYYGACVDALSDESDTNNNCSPAVTVTVGAVTSVPGAPAGLTATANGQTQIDLSWTAPSDDGGAAITGYKIEVSTDGSSWSDLVSNTRSTTTSYSHTGLTAGATRHYRVSAINSAGTGPASNSANATTSLATEGSPDLVADNTLLSANVTPGYNLSLNATVRNQGDGPSDSTTLRYYRSTDATITTSDIQVGTDPVDRLVPSSSIRHAIGVKAPSTPGTYYYGACVDAVLGESDAGNNCSTATEVTVRVVNSPPHVVGDIDDMTVTLGEGFRVDISGVFSEPDGEEIQNYGFTLRTKGILTGSVHTQTGILSLRAIGIGVTTVAVEASDIHGNGSGPHDLFVVTVVPAETTTAPGAPTGLSATADGQTEIDLSWTAPSDDGGEAITGYKIEVSTDGSSWSDLVSNTRSTTTSYSHTGLTAGATRHYRVSAINSAGAGPASNTDSSTTGAAPATVGNGNTYGVGDLLPGVPTSGLFIPAVVSGASLSSSGGSTTITFTNGGYIQLQDGTRFTCQSTGGCGVHNGEVTQGTIVGESTSVLTSDLIVDPPKVSDNAPTAGASFTLNATVRNQGNGSSESTTLRYYRSADSTITTSDSEVGTDSVSGLSASGSSDESISLTAPSDQGTYYYGACADSVSDEADTTNNCSAAVTATVGAAPAPDLTVSMFTAENSSPAGSYFTANATVNNQGNGSSTSTTLSYHRSTDATITTSDPIVSTAGTPGYRSVGGLSPFGSEAKSSRLQAPSTPGTYYYGACVDAVNGESDTTNNCSPAATVTVGAAAAPDLVVDTPTISESAPAAGASFTLNTMVRNQGNGPADSTTLRYYLSSDSTITTGDTEVGTDSVSDLGASYSGNEFVSLTAPSTSGTYYYGACADSVSYESDTTNNCSGSVQAIVEPPPAPDVVEPPPAPDLVVDTPTASESSLTAGRKFTLSFTVRNQGNRSSGPITLRYYRSNTLIASETASQVGYGGERSFTSETIIAHPFFAPSSDGRFRYPYISDGIYNYIVCVYPSSEAEDSDTTNNCSNGVTVTATTLTASSTCIVRYVLTPFDKCAHKVQGKVDVIYGEVDAFSSGLGFIYHDHGPLRTMTRSVSGSGPGNRQTTVHISNWFAQNWRVKSVLTSAGNERIIELRYWDD